MWLAGASALAPDGFAEHSVWNNLIARFASDDAPHARPVWFYLEALPRGFLPGTLLWPLVWLRLRRAAWDAPESRALRFLLAPSAAALLFLSLASGKRGIYLLPIYPLLATASAAGLAAWLAAGAAVQRGLRRGLAAVALVLALAGLGTLCFDRVSGVELPAAFGLALVAAPLLGLCVERVLRSRTAPRAALVGAVFSSGLGLELALHQALFPALDARNSLRPVAELVASVSAPDRPIGVYRNASLSGGIGYYSRRSAHDLREPADFARFTAAGGTAIVMEDDDFAQLRRSVLLRELGSRSCRQRRLLVVAPDG